MSLKEGESIWKKQHMSRQVKSCPVYLYKCFYHRYSLPRLPHIHSRRALEPRRIKTPDTERLLYHSLQLMSVEIHMHQSKSSLIFLYCTLSNWTEYVHYTIYNMIPINRKMDEPFCCNLAEVWVRCESKPHSPSQRAYKAVCHKVA